MQYKALPKAGLVLQLNLVGKLTKYTTSSTLKGGIVFNYLLGGAANHEPGWGDRIENLFKIKFPMMTIRQWL